MLPVGGIKGAELIGGTVLGYLLAGKKNGKQELVILPADKGTQPLVKFQLPVLYLERYTGSSSSYQKLIQWKVSAGSIGTLEEISIICDDYSALTIAIEIGGTYIKDKNIQSVLTYKWNGGIDLPPETLVLVWVKSDGATAINVDAMLTGREERIMT